MQCEMCGSEGELFRTSIEDAILHVCNQCSKYGQVLGPIRALESKKKTQTKMVKPLHQKETIFIIASDYASKIKEKREQLGLTQEEFAKKIRERESLLSKLEIGAIEPSIKLARKLEGFLGIKLVEEYKESVKAVPTKKGKGFTIGDIVKVKKRP